MILGCDPGQTGAVIAVQDGAVVGWRTWRPVTRGYMVRHPVADHDFGSPHLSSAIRVAIWSIIEPDLEIDRFVLERMFPGQMSSILCAESAGMVIAATEARLYVEQWHRPLAVDRKTPAKGWRYNVMGPWAARLSARAAGDHAIRMAREAGVLPQGLTKAEQEAWSEAYLMTRYRA